MSSIVAEAFRAVLVAELPQDRAEDLRNPIGPGPGYREINRALLLADRAKGWLGSVLARQEPGTRNRLETLGRLSRPEMGHTDLDRIGRELRHRNNPDWMQDVGRMVVELAEATSELDTERSNAQNADAFRAVSEVSARALLKLGDVRGNSEVVISEANVVLSDLVSLNGWENSLGPRFEPGPFST
jgi:hypothetical protein